MTEENIGSIEAPVEEPKEAPVASEESQSQAAPEPTKEKVFISEAELKALEQKVKSVKDGESKVTYEAALTDLRSALEEARRQEASDLEQTAMREEVSSLKQELAAIKEQAAQPQRRGVSHTPQSLFQKDDKGRTGVPVDVLEKLTREQMFKK